MRIIHFKHVLLSRLNHYFKTKQKVMIMKKIIFSAALFVAAIGFANAQSEGTAKKGDKAAKQDCKKAGEKKCCKKEAQEKK